PFKKYPSWWSSWRAWRKRGSGSPRRTGRAALRKGIDTGSHELYHTVLIQYDKNIFAKPCYFRAPPAVLIGMGLVITPLETPRRFNPLAQPLEASQKLGGREVVWRFDGGDITSDGGVLALKKLDARPLSRGFAVALRNNFRSGILAPQGRLRKRCKWLTPTQIS